MLIGILGGTFDPIHYGHLVVAEEVRESWGLDQIVFVPAAQPPHKEGSKVSPAEHRYRMTVLATKSNPFFKVSTIELERPGKSYSVETVREFKRVYGEETGLYFLMGSDSFLEITTWKDVDGLLQKCEFIVVTRPGYEITKKFLEKVPLKEKLKEKIHLLNVARLDISATDIRRRVSQGKSIRYLLPEEVEKYIYDNRLYRE